MIDGVKVSVHLGESVFRRFAIFSYARQGKRLAAILIYMVIMLVSAAACLLFLSWAGSSALLLCAVLTILALGLPAVYFAIFMRPIKITSKKLGLSKNPLVYEIILDDTGIASIAEGTQFAWRDVYKVYKAKDCFYVYVSQNKSYLLPLASLEQQPDVFIAYLGARLPKGRMSVLSY